jgi:hypothetical protein
LLTRPFYTISLEKLEVCLDDNYMASLQFYNKNISDKCDENTDFNILKQEGAKKLDIGGYPPEILMGITLEMSSYKERAVVTSYSFLTLVGDYGGTVSIFFMFFAFFGQILSSHSFDVAKVESNFISRNRDKLPDVDKLNLLNIDFQTLKDKYFK